jgi:predicted acylesterase/phospholipase RssA
MMAKNNIQKFLVLQGGGALGAYEAGVYRALYDWISDNPEKNK